MLANIISGIREENNILAESLIRNYSEQLVTSPQNFGTNTQLTTDLLNQDSAETEKLREMLSL